LSKLFFLIYYIKINFDRKSIFLIKKYQSKYNDFINLKRKTIKDAEKNPRKDNYDATSAAFKNSPIKNKHFKSMSFCDSDEIIKGFSKENENEVEVPMEKVQEDNIDLVINSLKMMEFEKELANLKSNIVFLINHLTDLDASQVFL